MIKKQIPLHKKKLILKRDTNSGQAVDTADSKPSISSSAVAIPVILEQQSVEILQSLSI